MELNHATQIAKRIVEMLAPQCVKINVAGSIRRLRSQVKDIEIVCIPKKEFVQTDLFGGGNWIVHPRFEKALFYFKQKIIKGNVHGRYMQMTLNNGGATMDLFMPQPHDYYRQLAIRTGSSEYSHLVIAHAWKKKCWVGTADGLRLEHDCVMRNDAWICINKNPTLPPVWQSEEEFYDWIGVPWQHPKYREVNKPVNV